MKLRKLWEQGPNCCWCGRLTRIISPYERPRHPPDEATREHLYTKYDRRRHNPTIQQPVEIACYECNHRRGGGMSWTYNLRGAVDV